MVEVGRDVEFIKQGDLCSVPFNIACGRCRMCKEGHTGVCLNVNPDRPGSAYGYVDMGGWQGGQAEYVMVPYADWNLLPFPDREQAMEKILDLTMLSDIFPTGYHGCVTAGVDDRVDGLRRRRRTGRARCRALGPAARGGVVIVGDMNADRLAHARSFGCETVDLTEERHPARADRADRRRARGRRRRRRGGLRGARATAKAPAEAPATVLNSIMEVTRAAGKLGIPGLYVTGDPGGVDEAAKEGSLSIRIGLGWAKSQSSRPASAR